MRRKSNDLRDLVARALNNKMNSKKKIELKFFYFEQNTMEYLASDLDCYWHQLRKDSIKMYLLTVLDDQGTVVFEDTYSIEKFDKIRHSSIILDLQITPAKYDIVDYTKPPDSINWSDFFTSVRLTLNSPYAMYFDRSHAEIIQLATSTNSIKEFIEILNNINNAKIDRNHDDRSEFSLMIKAMQTMLPLSGDKFDYLNI